MGIETPKQPTPEEQAKIEAERTLSDAELIKGGAEYKIDEEKGEKRLHLNDEQIENTRLLTGHMLTTVLPNAMRLAESGQIKFYGSEGETLDEAEIKHIITNALSFGCSSPIGYENSSGKVEKECLGCLMEEYVTEHLLQGVKRLNPITNALLLKLLGDEYFQKIKSLEESQIKERR